MTREQRQRRTFSESFKIKKVQEIESKQTRISEICKQYELSDVSIYKWLAKYGTMKNKKERIIVESQSDTQALLEYKKKVAELERIIGQKQILLDFKDRVIELAEETYHVDIKKKFGIKQSTNTGPTENNTPTVWINFT